MATYGIEVLTGLSESRLTGTSRTLRTVYWAQLQDGTSGSETVSEFDESIGFMSVTPYGQDVSADGGVITVSWDEGTKTLSWDLTGEGSYNLVVSLMLYA